jgi:hypothetical protein
MRPRQLAIAAVMILGCGGDAGGSPLMPSPSGVSLISQGDLQAVRWRHRHRRDYSWNEREAEGADRGDTNGFSGVIRLLLPEVARPAPRRRRGWVDPPPLQ